MRLLLLLLAFLVSFSLAIVLPAEGDDVIPWPMELLSDADLAANFEAFLASRNHALAANGTDTGNSNQAGNDAQAGNNTQTQMGSAQSLTAALFENRPERRWPFRGGDSKVDLGWKHKIPICFVDERSRNMLHASVCGAIHLWNDALATQDPPHDKPRNGAPSQVNRHSLSLVLLDKDNADYCCKKYTYGDEYQPLQDGDLACEWDHDKWPGGDQLAVHYVGPEKLRVDGLTTLGYLPQGKDGRHTMLLGAPPRMNAAKVAHELGHAMGLQHEHQRWDRDSYLEYKCDRLASIKSVVNKFMAGEFAKTRKIERQMAMDWLCTNYIAARTWGAPLSWIKGAGLKSDSPLDGPDGFDFDSIMIYPGTVGGYITPDMEPKLEEAVMYKIMSDVIRIPATGWQIRQPTSVSLRDAAMIRRLYPWDENRYQQYKNDPNVKKQREKTEL